MSAVLTPVKLEQRSEHRDSSSARNEPAALLADVVHIKEDPEPSREEPCSESQDAAQTSLYADHIIKDELVLGPETLHQPRVNSRLAVHIKEDSEPRPEEAVCVKEEPCSESRDAAQTSLYADHIIKDELVLGPETLHQPRVTSALKASPPKVHANVAQPEGQHCSSEADQQPIRNKPATTTSGTTPHYECNECGKGFRYKAVLQRHIHTHLSLKSSCNLTLGDIRLDQQQIRKTSNGIWKCSICEFKCSSRRNLRKHHAIHSSEKPFKCRNCDYTCRRKSNLQSHRLIHTDKKPFKCSICDYTCRRKHHLQNHRLTHTDEKPFKCSNCDYTCRFKHHLQYHRLTHTDEKPFKCRNCDYASRHKKLLQSHEMKHADEKPFKCSDCDYTCRHKIHLQRHLLTHIDEKPFKCSNCGYTCRHKYELQRHQLTHTDEMPFKCSNCDYTCRHKYRLQRHQTTHTDK